MVNKSLKIFIWFGHNIYQAQTQTDKSNCQKCMVEKEKICRPSSWERNLWWSCCLIKSWGRRSFLGICRQLVYLRKLRIVCAQKNGPSLDSAAGWKNFGQNWQLTSKLARLQDSKTPLSKASRLHFIVEYSVELGIHVT